MKKNSVFLCCMLYFIVYFALHILSLFVDALFYLSNYIVSMDISLYLIANAIFSDGNKKWIFLGAWVILIVFLITVYMLCLMKKHKAYAIMVMYYLAEILMSLWIMRDGYWIDVPETIVGLGVKSIGCILAFFNLYIDKRR